MSMFGGHPDPADPVEKIVQLAMLRFGVHNLNVSVKFGSGGPDAILVDHDGREYPMHNLVAHASTVPPNSDQFYQAIMAHVDAVVNGTPPPTPFPSAPTQYPPPAGPFPGAPVTFTDDRFALTEAPHVFPDAPSAYPGLPQTYAEAPPPLPFPGLPGAFPNPTPYPPQSVPGYPAPPPSGGTWNTPPLAAYPPPQPMAMPLAPPPSLQLPAGPSAALPPTTMPLAAVPPTAPQPTGLQFPPPQSTGAQYPPPQPSGLQFPPPQAVAMPAPPPQDPLLSLARIRLVPESARQVASIGYARPISSGLLAVLSTQTAPDIYLTDEFLEGRNITELFDAAFGNTMAEPFDANEEVAPGVRALAGDSPFTASKAVGMGLLLGRDLPPARLGVVFGAPNRHVLYVHVVTGPDLIHAVNALANLVVANATDDASGGALSNLTYYWTEAGIEPIGFPNGDGKVQIEATGAFGRMLNEVMR